MRPSEAFKACSRLGFRKDPCLGLLMTKIINAKINSFIIQCLKFTIIDFKGEFN